MAGLSPEQEGAPGRGSHGIKSSCRKISTAQLRACGLEIMSRIGRPLIRAGNAGREQIYLDPAGRTVRLRTSNERCLVVKSDHPDLERATKFDIDGTDDLLLVMPVTRRGIGEVEAYLVPTGQAHNDVLQCHMYWLSTQPRTSGANTPPAIWFDEGTLHSGGFAVKWKRYRCSITIDARTVARKHGPLDETSGGGEADGSAG